MSRVSQLCKSYFVFLISFCVIVFVSVFVLVCLCLCHLSFTRCSGVCDGHYGEQVGENLEKKLIHCSRFDQIQFKIDWSVKRRLKVQKFREDKMVAEVPFLFPESLK